MVERATLQGRIKGLKIARTAPTVSFLCFADDTLLFGHATVHEAHEFALILDTYAAISGQIINMEKSSMVFSPNTPSMVFGHMELFNLSLLAKQAWRILNQPQLLVARILKDKYFPHTDFMRQKWEVGQWTHGVE